MIDHSASHCEKAIGMTMQGYLRGAVRVLDLAGGGRYRQYLRQASARGFAADWAAVGGDLRRALDAVGPRVASAGASAAPPGTAPHG
jgi:hypothetical protein